MIKLFSLKQQKKDGEATPKAGTQKKASAAQLRITKGKQQFYFRLIKTEFNLPFLCKRFYYVVFKKKKTQTDAIFH